MINIIKLFSMTIVASVYLSMTAVASYTLNGVNIEGPEAKAKISLKSKEEYNTAVIWFDPSNQKEIKVKWTKFNRDLDDIVDEKIKLKGGILCETSIVHKEKIFVDEEGLWGCIDNQKLKITAEQFFFNRTSLMFENKASIVADKLCPSVIRSLEFLKESDQKSILLYGGINFTKKDGNFTGPAKIPGLLIAGISELIITFDKTKI